MFEIFLFENVNGQGQMKTNNTGSLYLELTLSAYSSGEQKTIIFSQFDGWMDDLQFYILFNSISVILG